MGIYDKIQVAIIAILVKFENTSRATKVLKKICQEVCSKFRVLVLLIKAAAFFSVFILVISVMVARAH